jgi:ribose transport system substrate-binding protein
MRVMHKPINALGLINSLMVGAALAPALAGALAHPASAQPQQKSLRFVVIPKLSHPWYDMVGGGAQQAATMIERQSGGHGRHRLPPPGQG